MERSLRPKTDKDFGAPPPGYVAGVGRGASGFASGVSRNGPIKKDEADKDVDVGDAGYDKFAGFSGSLFGKGAYDKDDDEADRMYDMVEARMESRRKKARHERDRIDREQFLLETPDLQQQFLDVKKDLSKVSEEEWMNLPVAQERQKAKRIAKDSYTNAPDSLLLGSSASAPALPPGMPSSITEVGEAKQSVLNISLRKEETVTTSSMDSAQYLEELAMKQSAQALGDIAEVKKARLLFRSVTKSDPTNPTGWIAAARLEEVSGNIPDAKSILARGLAACPTGEDLWLLALRLEADVPKAKALAASGIRQIPSSVKLWSEAARLEEKNSNKIRVFQKALESIPTSVVLWKSLINLTTSRSDALMLLSRSVECCPTSEELWLTYAKLSDFESAQKVLNEARRAIPTSAAVWVCAAELAESMTTSESAMENIFGKAIESLEKNGVVLSISEWVDKACVSERNGSKVVPKILVSVVLRRFVQGELESGRKTAKELKHIVFSEHDRLMGFPKDEFCLITTESILSSVALHTPLRERKGVWIKLVSSLQGLIDAPRIIFYFEQAILACPHSELLFLMFAKYLWATVGDVEKARLVLAKARESIESSEDIYIACAKIERASRDFDSTRSILATARAQCPKSVRLWIKAAQLERELRNIDACIDICQQAKSKLKGSDVYKLWLIEAQSLLEGGRIEQSATVIAKACEVFPSKPSVWIVAADVAIAAGDVNRARSILERARVRLGTDENLWWKGFVVEQLGYGSNSGAVRALLSRALQACPSSGLLWSCAIETEPVATRHPKCLDGLKRCPNNPLVVAAVARFFWLEKLQIDKARKWFENAVEMSPEYGQVWSDFLAFELSQGEDNAFNVERVMSRVKGLKEEVVNKGIEWNQFRKQPRYWYEPLRVTIVDFSKTRFAQIYDNIENSTLKELLDLALATPVEQAKVE